MIASSEKARHRLTTVMYHYVRPVAQSAFPRLKALDLTDFLLQLDDLQTHYTILPVDEIAAILTARAPLPERACVLTFDDGYCDHYRYVFPHLVARRLGGLFFAPKSSLIDRHLLDVNRIQFALASQAHPEALADEVDAIIAARGFDPAPLRTRHFAPNRFDGPEVAYVKRLLQNVLSSDLRSEVTAALFAKHVTADAAGFAEELYLSVEQAREMRSYGMEFGGHGDVHLWHGLASAEELTCEVTGAAQALQAIGAPVAGGFYSYPFGSVTQAVKAAISAAGFRVGFTVQPDLWVPGSDSLGVPRLDTNDLPRHPLADLDTS